MAQDTLLGFPAHTLPYRCVGFTTLSTVSRLHRNKSVQPFQQYFSSENPSAFCSGWDGGASAGPLPQSGGYVRGSR